METALITATGIAAALAFTVILLAAKADRKQRRNYKAYKDANKMQPHNRRGAG